MKPLWHRALEPEFFGSAEPKSAKAPWIWAILVTLLIVLCATVAALRSGVM